MAGEKKVGAGSEDAPDARCVNYYMSGEWPNVSESDKNRADEGKESDTLKSEGNFFRVVENQIQADYNPKNNWAVDKYAVNVKNPNVAQNNISYRPTSFLCRVNDGEKGGNDADE